MDKKQFDTKTITAAAKHFEKFYQSESFPDIIDHFATVCELLRVSPTNLVNFYPHIKEHVKSCQGMNLFKLLDERTKHPVFENNMAASNTKMVVIGAGPIGLRTAIEAQLLGARVTVIEKRTSFTRNNVLHLWPWVIEDLKSLGAKNFYPRFCTGTMNHISIRRLQCILLKTALCFGVEVFGGVEFQGTEEPDFEGDPWRLTVSPAEHPVNSLAMDMLVGAEGKRVTLPGFRRKEFRGKLAIAITANFTNKRTTAEAVVEEISGVAFVYKQDFFNNLYDELGIALENIVYYKDETHYFVMTTKKHSLLDRNVLVKDLKDPIALLSPKNVNKDALYEYIRDACDYCTDYQLPNLEFALNHYGQPDVALFDFTSMFASANACHVLEKKNSQLLFGLVGDGLLEPFWPTGTGIARGFLGAFDCVWMLRQWAAGDKSPSEVIAERESILKLLPQTTPENITKDFKNMCIVPRTRYPNLQQNLYGPHQVDHLYISDTQANKDMPRFHHLSFKEVSSKSLIRRAQTIGPPKPVNSSMRFENQNAGQAQTSRPEERQQMAGDFYKKMMQQRLIDGGSTTGANNSPGPVRSNATVTSRSAPTLQEKLDAKRVTVDRETGQLKKDKDKDDVSLKNILNNQASKAEFVKKMSKTFGYGMPSNAEPRTDTLASEAEKCALLVKSSNMRQSSNSNTPATNRPKKKKSVDAKKSAKLNQVQATREREIKPWQFDNNSQLHSSVAPIVPSLDIEIDPELDFLLAELEEDEEFKRLPENDQKTWLESLFFQDTLHLPGRAKAPPPVVARHDLNPTKPAPKNRLRVNANASEPSSGGGGGGGGGTVSSSRSDMEQRQAADNAVHVNDKMRNLAQDFFKPSTGRQTQSSAPAKDQSKPGSSVGSDSRHRSGSWDQFSGQKETATSKITTAARVRDESPLATLPSPSLSRKSSLNSYATPPTSRKHSLASQTSKENPVSINNSMEEISGVNKNLCSLAQSYFSSTPVKPTVSRKSSVTSDSRHAQQPHHDSEDGGKASLVASFFGGANTLPSTPKKNKVFERASYQPTGSDDDLPSPVDEDDAELEKLIQQASRKAEARDEAERDPPPPPPRKLDKQAMMLKMLGNATGILQGKR